MEQERVYCVLYDKSYDPVKDKPVQELSERAKCLSRKVASVEDMVDALVMPDGVRRMVWDTEKQECLVVPRSDYQQFKSGMQ